MEKLENENRLTVKEAAKLMGTTEETIRVGMRTGAFNIGYCMKQSSIYTYIILAPMFTKATGIEVRGRK